MVVTVVVVVTVLVVLAAVSVSVISRRAQPLVRPTIVTATTSAMTVATVVYVTCIFTIVPACATTGITTIVAIAAVVRITTIATVSRSTTVVAAAGAIKRVGMSRGEALVASFASVFVAAGFAVCALCFSAAVAAVAATSHVSAAAAPSTAATSVSASYLLAVLAANVYARIMHVVGIFDAFVPFSVNTVTSGEGAPPRSIMTRPTMGRALSRERLRAISRGTASSCVGGVIIIIIQGSVRHWALRPAASPTTMATFIISGILVCRSILIGVLEGPGRAQARALLSCTSYSITYLSTSQTICLALMLSVLLLVAS